MCRKLLFYRPPRGADLAVILHVRRSDSPFAHYVVTFRDWLRANPDEAAHYEDDKRALAMDHVDDDDYDDYTRAKTAFLNDVQPRLDQWARDARQAMVFRQPSSTSASRRGSPLATLGR
ncbi:GrpB family protein [Tersicoccus sp. MR15.9]|uniref:GrpB family protein n=1 Tax=Tersicoccus mangrovi TaxID=3121635 RepID=UPI002FE61078